MKKIIYIIVAIVVAVMLLIYNVKNKKRVNNMNSIDGVKRVEKSWDKIFKYWNSIESKPHCKGATKEEIEKLKNGLKLELPKSFICSLEICNGDILEKTYEKKYNEEIKKNPYKHIKLGTIELFNIDKILEFRYVGEETPEEWIPLAYWYGAYSIVLDTRKDTFGQIIFAVVEDSTYKVLANSYEEWLEMMTDEVIKHGEVREEFLEQVYHDKSLKTYDYPGFNKE